MMKVTAIRTVITGNELSFCASFFNYVRTLNVLLLVLQDKLNFLSYQYSHYCALIQDCVPIHK